jgi:uncharacterized protein with NRDE domain
MCLIVLGWHARPEFPLIVAANRDEFHARPAAPAAFWDDKPGILAGRDLEARGTWMGISRSGRFAAVTNYRGAREPGTPHSRGALVTGFLESDLPPGNFLKNLESALYSGFNLFVCDGEELWWMSNRNGAPRKLDPGVYGQGNLLLDAPEVDESKRRFDDALPAVEPLFSVISPARIVNSQYGTRCSTVLLKKQNRVRYVERTFAGDGAEQDTVSFEF